MEGRDASGQRPISQGQPSGPQPGDGVHVMAETLRVRGEGGGGMHQRQEGRPEGSRERRDSTFHPQGGSKPFPLPRVSKQVEGLEFGVV